MTVAYATIIELAFVFFIDLKQNEPISNHDFTVKNEPKQPSVAKKI